MPCPSYSFASSSVACFVSLPFMRFFFFFNDTATTEIYTLSLHDALPISQSLRAAVISCGRGPASSSANCAAARSEEHTSELQSLRHLVCRLLLEKKKKNKESSSRQKPEIS